MDTTNVPIFSGENFQQEQEDNSEKTIMCNMYV